MIDEEIDDEDVNDEEREPMDDDAKGKVKLPTIVSVSERTKDAIAAAYARVFTTNVIDVVSMATETFDKHAADALLVALGIEPDRWNNGSYKLDTCNGYVGHLHRFIKRLAEKRAASMIDEIKEQTIKMIDKQARSAKGRRDFLADLAEAYNDAYEDALRQLLRKELDHCTLKIRQELVDTIHEASKGTVDVSKITLQNVIESLEKGETR